MRKDTRQRKRTLAGLRAIAGEERMLGPRGRVISSDTQVLDAGMLEMGRMVAESVMLIEREEVAGPDYYPTDPGRTRKARSLSATRRLKRSAPAAARGQKFFF